MIGVFSGGNGNSGGPASVRSLAEVVGDELLDDSAGFDEEADETR